MIQYYYHPDLVRFAFVVGIAVSIMFYERRHLTTGGIAVPGYLAFAIFQPMIVPAILLVAWASYLLVHKGLTRLVILPASVTFSILVLTSSAIHLSIDMAFGTILSFAEGESLLRGIGYVVPGLIAHDFSRHGVRKSVTNIGLSSAVVAVLLAAIITLLPDLARLQPSPVADVFPISLQYLPMMVFLSLIAWLGLARMHDLRCGGFLGAAYFSLLVLQPDALLQFVLVSLGALMVVRVFLDPIAILFGRRRFAAHMLVGACLSWTVFKVSELYFTGETISALTPSLSVVGVLLAGLLANDMDRVGIKRTFAGCVLGVGFTLSGTLLILEALTHQRLVYLAPLGVVFLSGAVLMACSPARLQALRNRLWTPSPNKENREYV